MIVRIILVIVCALGLSVGIGLVSGAVYECLFGRGE